MNPLVNSIAGRLSLRPPQRASLEILDRAIALAPLRKGADLAAALAAIQSEYPGVTDFERAFPSLCFALATGVGKTRLMGAFISYLFLAHGAKNFFVLAPNLTIYEKLIADFTPNTPKYVFRGIAEFGLVPPVVINGENYGRQIGDLFPVRINIFNISKINAEVRGGRAPRIRGFREEIGESYFDWLAGLDDLVLIMDESHRYRASAGIRAINELKPLLGLELTATPFVEAKPRPVRFRNVVYDYPLARAIEDGFVKEPAVVTRRDFDPAGMTAEAIERLKLDDGIRLHESVRVELETYARQTANRIVKPFVLVIARDIPHAAELEELIKSAGFFEGRYAAKVIRVDSGEREGAESDEVVARLLKIEDAAEPTEIVIHVSMLKEGWDVTNLYTIVPLRTADARTLVEQSIGRGLRLPYGRLTGVIAVDRLNIVAHDRFQEIVDAARRPDSPVRLRQVELDPAELDRRTATIVSQPQLATQLGLRPPGANALPGAASAFSKEEETAAQIAYGIIRRTERPPDAPPGVAYLQEPDVQAGILREVESAYQARQTQVDGTASTPDLAAIVSRVAALAISQTIPIPRISVVPKGASRSGFRPFRLDLREFNYPPPSDDIWIQHIRTNTVEVLGLDRVGADEHGRLEDMVVNALVDFDDIAYQEQSELLYDLAGQVVAHFLGTLSEDDTRRVLGLHQKQIAALIHVQMNRKENFREDAGIAYDVVVRERFTELKSRAFTATAAAPRIDFRLAPADRSNMAQYVFAGFARCLYAEEKFQSDSERQLAVILDRDSLRWFRPARGQFQIFYRPGAEHREYQPDFVAEAADRIFMLEAKAANMMSDAEVLAKQDAAVTWCGRASAHARSHGGKPWSYALIPHDAIVENMTLDGLAARFVVSG
jgi:type III restriction enzyme